MIAAPPSLGVVEVLGSGLALSDDGRRLAATASTADGYSVLVFDKQVDGRWQYMAQLPGASDRRRIAMSGNGLVIAFGAQFEVRVHACGNNTWPLRATLRSDDYPYASDAAFDDFGSAGLALSDDGTTLAVGAPRSRSTTQAGGVYIFGDGNTGWQKRTLLVNSGEPGPDLFGLRLALSGDGRVLAASACGRFTPASGVNRNYASSTPPVSAEACNPLTQHTGLSHGAQVFQRDDAGTWTQAASVVPTLPPLVQPGPLAENLIIPLLSRDGSVLGLGAYRNRAEIDGKPGEANLLIY